MATGVRKASLLFFLIRFSLVNLLRTEAAEAPFEGDPSCPCLLGPEDGLLPLDDTDITPNLRVQLGDFNQSSYGVGCAPHDKLTPQCTSDECVLKQYLPAASDCDRSWCERPFCWVDPLNCTLLNRRSQFFKRSGLYYSYATCYAMDSFTQNYLLNTLADKTLKVGANSNSGGWTGAYSSTKEHFETSVDLWRGPAFEFAIRAAEVGRFRMNLTAPPNFLLNKSVEFFSKSKFDYCVYAVALGYLDLCVSQYSVTNTRATSTDWFVLGNEPLLLIVQTDEGLESNWSRTMGYISTIFQPFTPGAWLFIVLCVIPLLAIFFLVHEYGQDGSAFPKTEELVVSTDSANYEVKEHKIPLYRHLAKSFYITLLSVLHQSFETSIVSVGAMLNLLGVAFFILTIIAVYTANLAAILTQQAQISTVKSFEDALSRGWRICGERTNVAELGLIYGVPDSAFVKDPVELGGDGKPGFTCAKCQSRSRVFDFLDAKSADSDERYCHAALAPMQDLEVLQNQGVHCNKTSVGQAVRYIQSGFPISERISREATALFLKVKNDGAYDKELVNARPTSRCSGLGSIDTADSALSVAQLMGIWVVTFGFAIAGLLVTCGRPCWKKAKKQNGYEVKRLHQRDQYGAKHRNSALINSLSEANSKVNFGELHALDEEDETSRSSPNDLEHGEGSMRRRYMDSNH